MSLEVIPFEIAHCSSFEEGYEPDHLVESGNEELDPNEQYTGWQTKKYPEYPQDLIVQLKNGPSIICKVQLLSHHYKIASQIELYAGITKQQEHDSMFIEFTRLGFVTLDNNNRFQDRELKSIKIQADCEYLRIVIRGCHDNRLNVHKQASFLALNILGHNSIIPPPLSNHHTLTNNLSQEDHKSSSFKLQTWIKVIQNAEEEAAQDEDYKEAKIYKELGDRLLGLNKFLCNLEHEKQVVVAKKDYEEAEKIKEDIAQVMKTAETLLEQCGIQITSEGELLPAEPTAVHLGEEEEERDDAHIPTDEITNWTSFDALSIQDGNKQEITSPSLLSARIPIPITNTERQTTEKTSPAKPLEDPENTPEPLTKEDMETCKLPLDVFGMDMIACILSVKVKCRQRGLGELSKIIVETVDLMKQEDAHVDPDFIHASLLMLQEAVMDSRELIFNQTIQIWYDLQELCSAGLLDDINVFKWIERFFTAVLSRTADSNIQIKTKATQVVLELIKVYHDGQMDLIPLCIKERMVRNLKEAKSRVQLVKSITEEILLPIYGTSKVFPHLKDVVNFLISYYKNHHHADVRQSTWEVLLCVAQRLDINTLRPYLDSDTIRSLEKDVKKNESKATVNELRALAVKSNGTTAKKPQKVSGGLGSKATVKKQTQTKKKKEQKKEEKKQEENDASLCLFCEEHNPKFNEDTLITHYYNHCPVLTNCPMCKTILEVSTLRDHLLVDCERSHLVKQCNHCKYPVPVEQWLQHTLKNNCTETSDNQTRCPFCQLDMTSSTEADWRMHLMDECPKNPRRRKQK
ncbi:hypothetical protein RMATCC62417_14748 [Rhizopus microsporus]|nr:hypothetical protein RMATCC62417_14748 [Rhizopus microsporus]